MSAKSTNFEFISDEKIQKVKNWVNNRVFKVLNWVTHNQAY